MLKLQKKKKKISSSPKASSSALGYCNCKMRKWVDWNTVVHQDFENIMVYHITLTVNYLNCPPELPRWLHCGSRGYSEVQPHTCFLHMSFPSVKDFCFRFILLVFQVFFWLLFAGTPILVASNCRCRGKWQYHSCQDTNFSIPRLEVGHGQSLGIQFTWGWRLFPQKKGVKILDTNFVEFHCDKP